MIPCYSSNSPEDTLIPCFPAQSTDRLKRVLRRLQQNRFTTSGKNLGFYLRKAALLFLLLTGNLPESTLWYKCDKSIAKRRHQFLCGILSFLWWRIVSTDVTWMHLVLLNWLQIGAVKMLSLGPSAVSAQIMIHLIFCVQGQMLSRNKRLVEHLVGTKSFPEKRRSDAFGVCRAGYRSANWTLHSLLSGFAGIRLSISEDL